MQSIKTRIKKQLNNVGLLRYYYDFYPQKPIYIPTLLAYWRISRWNVYLRFRIRMIYFLMRNGFKLLALSGSDTQNAEGQGHLKKVIDRNYVSSNFALPFARRRTEHLIYILHSIPSVNKTGRLLSIGPRNEGDMVLLHAHGFTQVEGIDLFTYSPEIRLMDMHHMEYADNSFDLISCGWVVRYSYDIKQCAREIIRVCKNGAHVAIAFSMNPHKDDGVAALATPLRGGIDELLSYFEPHIGYVYWRLEDQNTDETNIPECTNSVVFRIKKSP